MSRQIVNDISWCDAVRTDAPEFVNQIQTIESLTQRRQFSDRITWLELEFGPLDDA